MPVRTCRENDRPGYRWGERGKCYTYTSGNDAERREAKRKAIIQGVAVERRRGRQSLTGEQFTGLSEQAIIAADREHLPGLVAAWQATLEQAASQAADRFALTAAAEPDWQPPPEGWTLTPAIIAELAAALDSRLEPIFRAIVEQAGGAPLARVGIAWDVSHPLAQGLLARAGGRTGRRLGEAVGHQLREILRVAYDEGLSVPETAARIRAGLTEAAPWQADMLARTDLNALANGSSKAAAGLAGMGFKSWLSARDPKVRPDHVDADGQTVPLDQPFVICGGEEADFPGDFSLSDACAANCRCTLVYSETLEEAGGLLADAGASIIPGMASTRQRARRAARRRAAVNGEALTAAAIGVHHTETMEGDWDGNAAMTRATSAADYRAICAWRDASGDPDERGSYKFPHHASAGGPANMAGVRNALARLSQADIPASDRAGVERHLRAHLADHNRRRGEQGLLADARPVAFEGICAIEGELTDDNSPVPRVLLARSLSWDPPVPFMAQTVTAEGHEGAEVAGRIDKFRRVTADDGKLEVIFSGELTTPYGIDEIAPMIDDETLRGVSIDLGATEWVPVYRDSLEQVPEEEFSMEALAAGEYAAGLKSGKIRAVTLTPVPALERATVALAASGDGSWELLGSSLLWTPDDTDEEEALVASPAPMRPPRAWFETAEPPGKMPLTVTAEGRVYGHLATWDSCHVGFLPSCVPPPRSPSQYAYFHVCELDGADGETVTVGKLMFSPDDGGHADRRLSPQRAAAYYDRTGMAAAYLRVVDGEHGIWAAGSLNPDLSDEQRKQMRRELRLHPPSGDWRMINSSYELIAALAVAIPGYPLPRGTAEITVVASADGIEVKDAIIASSGWFEPDEAALAALEHEGLLDDEALAERRLRTLAARAEGLDTLAALASE